VAKKVTEEKELIEAEESESTSEAESAEEYFAEEPIEIGEMNPSEIDLMLKKSEIWDKLSRGEISIEKAKEIFAGLTLPTTVEERRRRRRRSKRK